MGLFTEPIPNRHCRQCEHWAGDLAGGSHILCVYGNRKLVHAQPESGCVHWVRAIGADDEDSPKRRA